MMPDNLTPQQRWNARNAGKVAAASKKWRAKNKQAISDRNRTYREQNRDQLTIRSRQRYAVNGGKEKSRVEAHKRRAKDPARDLAYQRQWRYGITQDQFNEIFEKQGSRCAICPTTEPGPRGWHVDHDHNKNKGDLDYVRGITCRKCNLMLGFARDNPEILAAAINYLVR